MNIFSEHPWRTYFLLLVSTLALAVAAPSQKLKETLLGIGSPQPRMTVCCRLRVNVSDHAKHLGTSDWGKMNLA